MSIAAAAIWAGVLALVSRALRWLTNGGTVAAWLVGTLVFAGGDLTGAALLALFFVSGSALTVLTERATGPRHVAGGHTSRTARQVVANGLWPAVGAVGIAFEPLLGWSILVGSLTAAQADTWATEIGYHAPRWPRLITSGLPVAPGTSGGVSPRGTLAGIGGAVAMGLLALVLGVPTFVAVSATIGGIAGMLVDSVLGATLQASYVCETCNKQTEARVHRCGRRTSAAKGVAWIDNDVVNLLGSGTGALFAVGAAVGSTFV